MLQKMITSGLKHYYKQYTITHISIIHIQYHIIINTCITLSQNSPFMEQMSTNFSLSLTIYLYAY